MSKYIKPWRPLLFSSAQPTAFAAGMPSDHMNTAQPSELACLPQESQSHNEAQELLLLQEYKGGPNSVSKNHISFRCQKRTQKLVPCTCLSRSWQSFPFCYVDERGPVSKACNRGASRLGEAWPRPRLGRNTYWHKDKARLTGTRNYIILLSKSQQGWTWSSW